MLEEFLKPTGITPYRLAKEIGVSQRRIGKIVAGKRAVTADTGLRLSIIKLWEGRCSLEKGDPLAISQKKFPSKIGARTETKVDNGKNHHTEANFIDHFAAEIFFIPIGRFDEILKAADQGSFG